MKNIAKNLENLRLEIAKLSEKAERAAPPALMAVSKNHGREKVEAAYEAGQRLFGENRVQEAAEKLEEMKKIHEDLELHLIGPLQTNKAAAAIALFDVIETLDRPKLAAELSKEMRKQGVQPRFYVEVNLADEPQKAGITPDQLAGFLTLCREEYGLEIEGLMAIPPFGLPPEPFFKQLKELASLHKLPQISMGMSGDYEAAIKEGSTQIRIGTAIFGEREY